FHKKISPDLVAIVRNSESASFPSLRDAAGYLAVKLAHTTDKKTNTRYAVVEIPIRINRLVELREEAGKEHMTVIDDVPRMNLINIFSILSYDTIAAHMIKITRDAELEVDSDLHKSFIAKISEGVKDRRVGEVVRFVYDKEIDEDTLQFFLVNMGIDNNDSIIPGGRYHNRRDYMNFPSLGRKDLVSTKDYPLPVQGLDIEKSMFLQIKEKDFLVHTPFQSFNYVVKVLREAAIDP